MYECPAPYRLVNIYDKYDTSVSQEICRQEHIMYKLQDQAASLNADCLVLALASLKCLGDHLYSNALMPL